LKFYDGIPDTFVYKVWIDSNIFVVLKCHEGVINYVGDADGANLVAKWIN
jgi:hypothetical protein